ncbi:hypothetical protein [Kribbella sp. VKM Ac-2569]|uniref:hypothetical protein n=1 Tax=Kribbella sp. VKM Ac-2569 TaxID=2512220 RepID=UPI001300AB01|nr:hypothetical protein [Kribbella sp. VKM Ac-2569]
MPAPPVLSAAQEFVEPAAALVFGVVGWLLTEWGVPLAPLVMGMILGPLLEVAAQQSFALSPTFFLERPIFIAFAALTVVSVLFGMRLRRKGMAGDED